MKGFYIIIRGPLGCGKSTIAEFLSKKLNAEHLAIDRVLDENGLTSDKEEGFISQKSFKKANEIISPKAEEILKQGKIVVFDGNFYWKSQIDDLVQRLDYEHYVFTLKASVETCVSRDIERGKTHGEDAARAVYKKSTSFSYGEGIETEGKKAEEVVELIFEELK
jgi:predicted kinase